MSVLKTIQRLFRSEGRSAILGKNILASFVLKGISIIISFLLVPITIGYVSSELYGVWLTLSSIMTWLSFMDVGFTQGLKNKLTEAIAQNNWVRGKSLVSTTYFMMLLIFLPLCAILEFVVPNINWCHILNVNPIYNDEIIKTMRVLVAFFCMQMVINVIVSVVAAFQKVALSSSFSVIGQALAFVVILLLVKLVPPSLTVLSVVFGGLPVLVTFFASLFLYTGRYRFISPSLSGIKVGLVSDLFNLGYKFFIINVQAVVLYQSTNFLISYVSSPLAVTSYNIAYRYLNMAMMVFTLITAPLWPAYTDAYVKDDIQWMNNMRKKMIRVYLLSVLVCVIMAVISDPVYHLWVGNKAEVPIIMTIMVMIYVIIYCWMNLNGTILVGIGKVKLETIMVAIGMIIHLPLSLLLAKYISCYGVLLSMTVITLLYGVVFHIQVNKVLKKEAKGIWNQ